MTTADRIRARRQLAGWSQSQLADRLDVESMQVSRWERGESTPSLPSLRRLADAFGCTLDELVPRPAGTAIRRDHGGVYEGEDGA